MGLFDNVKKQQVSGASTKEYELFEVMDGASLIVSPATRSNKAYFASLFKMGAGFQRRAASGNITPELAEKARNLQKPIYAKHVIKGWKGVVGTNDDGEEGPVEFSTENCLELLKALPNFVFDGLLEFCENEANFSEDEIDVGELGNV